MNNKSIGLSPFLDIFGSRVSMDNSFAEAIQHKIEGGWRCFYKWKHVLTSSASLNNKLDFFRRTVLRSLLWALATCKSSQNGLQKEATAMHLMVRKMLGLKRQPVLGPDSVVLGVESWLDWQIRSMSRASSEIRQRGLEIGELVDAERLSWAAHVARFSLDGKPPICLNTL